VVTPTDVTFKESKKNVIVWPIKEDYIFKGSQWWETREGVIHKREGLKSSRQSFWVALLQLKGLVQEHTNWSLFRQKLKKSKPQHSCESNNRSERTYDIILPFLDFCNFTLETIIPYVCKDIYKCCSKCIFCMTQHLIKTIWCSYHSLLGTNQGFWRVWQNFRILRNTLISRIEIKFWKKIFSRRSKNSR